MNRPPVCLDATSLVVYSYGYDEGKNGPTHCTVIEGRRGGRGSDVAIPYGCRLLLDSRVVDLTMSYNPIFVTVASLKSLFFNGLKNELRFVEHMEA